MSNDFSLNVQVRELQGKGASRRLRHTNLVPAVIYGGDEPAQSIAIKFNELIKALENEAFYSHILTLNVDGQSQQVVMKALQRHPSKSTPMHVDFYRVRAGQEITMRVPLHFVNTDTAVGVKTQGGIFSSIATDVEVRTLPSKLPEFIEVDVAEMELGQTLHLTDLKLPEGVVSTELALGEEHNLAIASIHHPEPAEPEADDAGTTAEE